MKALYGRSLGHHAVIEALCRHQGFVAAPLCNAPIIDNKDLIRTGDRMQAVGNDQKCLALYQLTDGRLDQSLIVRVHACGGFVQNDDRCVFQNAACNGNSLHLATGKGSAAFTDDCIEAFVKSHNKIVASCFLCGFENFVFSGISPMVVNVVLAAGAFDPYPFILLNLVLSCVAAIQAPLIMMSQNRQEEKDRRRAENDYKVNLKTEIMIEDLYDKVNAVLAKQSALERQVRGDCKEESETAE